MNRLRIVLLAMLFTLPALPGGARADGAPAVQSPHGRFKDDCQLCHSASGWKQVRVSPKVIAEVVAGTETAQPQGFVNWRELWPPHDPSEHH